MMTNRKRIALLGATSQIAKNLVVFFDDMTELKLFCRNKATLQTFLDKQKPAAECVVLPYSEFGSEYYDVIINCVGVADPKLRRDKPYEAFQVTEQYDNLALDYLLNQHETKYIFFSSGAVFGANYICPVDAESLSVFYPNKLSFGDSYGIAKLNAEAKHRCLDSLSIVDIRVFSFFSRYADLDSGFFLSEAVKCLLENKEFVINDQDFMRDFIAPKDLFCIVSKIIAGNKMNTCVDAISARPVSKDDLLDLFIKKYYLVFRQLSENKQTSSSASNKYYSMSMSANHLLGFVPTMSSIETIEVEVAAILAQKNYR